VAIVSIALITVTLLSQLVSVQPARAANPPPRPSVRSTAPPSHDQLTSDITSTSKSTAPATAVSAPFHLGVALLAGKPAGTKEVAPVAPPAPADTVTPAQRAAWERVAMCEEGGNWHADGSRFSGGLGITRANWANYGGLQYASEGALATPDQQIMVAERIQSSPPDQGGCRSW
jgi:hypothetical protein